MAAAHPSPTSPAPARDHGFHAVAVHAVVAETHEAATFVFDVPADLAERYVYEPGQFCTVRVVLDGAPLLRCYSMSSTPGVDERLAVTVKRVPGGAVSNWLIDNVAAGTELELTPPAGVFVLAPEETKLVAFAAGSGITPVMSLVKSALHDTDRRVRLLYANRDADSVIFADELEALVARFPDRLEVVHHHDVEAGFVDAEEVRDFLGTSAANGSGTAVAGHYLCGPAPFMDLVEEALLAAGVAPERIHLERFSTPVDEPPTDTAEDGCTVTVELDGTTASTEHRAGTTILQTARQLDLSPPFSCESGSCATCMARLVTGTVQMRLNNALTDDEVDDGWILTCQSVPTSAEVSVVYGYEEGA